MLIGVLTLLMLVLLFLWMLQLVVSVRNVLRGGTKCDRHNALRRRAELMRQARLERAAKAAPGRSLRGHRTSQRKRRTKRKARKGKRERAGDIVAAAQQLEAADLTEGTTADGRSRAQNWRQRRTRCTYASRDAIRGVLRSSVFVKTVPRLDERSASRSPRCNALQGRRGRSCFTLQLCRKKWRRAHGRVCTCRRRICAASHGCRKKAARSNGASARTQQCSRRRGYSINERR